MLQDLTGQESGIVIYPSGETIITNWSSLSGLPRVFATGIIGSGGAGVGVESEEHTDDISKWISNDNIIYDANDDAGNLPGTPGTVYTLSGGTRVIAPDNWN